MGQSFVRWIGVLMGCTWCLVLSGQDQWALRILPLDKSPAWLQAELTYDSTFADSSQVIEALGSVIGELQLKTYLEASVDTIVVKDQDVLAILHVGPPYQWVKLGKGNVEESLLGQTGFRPRFFNNKAFSQQGLKELQDAILIYLENHGYPFANLRLDSLKIDHGRISGVLHVEKGDLYTFDDLTIEGNANVSETYLSSYLGLKPGTPYDQRKILRVRDRIRELPFLQSRRDLSVTFEGEQAKVNLFVDKKQASRFDFLIGVLPSSAQTGRVLITGTFNAELQNQFGLGERIYAAFEQLRPQTQELELEFNYPYVLGTPFGADMHFELYRRDTNYLDLRYNIGAQYLLEGGSYLKAFWNNYTSNLLSVDTVSVLQTGQLPDTLDVSHSTFGLEYNHQKLDYRFNPRKGWSAFIKAGTGVKTIRRNNLISQLDIPDPYADLNLRSFIYRIEANLAAYIPMFKTSTLKSSLQSGFVITEEPIFANEQFRLGGNRLLRGFDEESIFATNYAVFTLEYRLLIGQNSFLYTFGDYARLDEKTIKALPGQNTVDYPYGFGGGISFETKVGVFGISLAFGSRKQNPIDFGAPKVHFGYISLF
ncbi:MAG: BamA/TamA family outer membrane protein [Cyanothece sp. SIO1E1]|nr:BamA/TamA family outer membrane protein [Cyanothece sp. SIO1E1]